MRTFLLIFALFSVFTSTAQNANRLVGGIGVVPGDRYAFGGKIAYFHQKTFLHALGVKMAFNTNALGAEKTANRSLTSNIDLVGRWSVTKHDQIRLSFDAGISVRQHILITVGGHYGGCSTGLTTEDLERKYADPAVYHGGIALATSLDFRLTQQCFAGFEMSGNTYFERGNETMFLYLNPALTCTYLFGKWKRAANSQTHID